MSIKFYLIDNKLTPDPRDRRAVVVSGGSRSLEDVIEEAADSGTMVTKTDISAVLGIAFKVIAKMLSQGLTVTTPLVNIRPTIKGVFATELASFDPEDHEIRATCVAGPLLKEYLAKATPEKVEASNKVPHIKEFMDETTGTPDGEITPGGMAIIKGFRFTFDPLSADEGYFFIDASGTETKVSRIAKSIAKEAIFQIPDSLTTGHYEFVIRTRSQSMEIRKNQGYPLEVK